METNGRVPQDRTLWAYGYEFAPPIARGRLGRIETLLSDGRLEAELAAHTWEGRFVNGDLVTHLLIVSDRPDRDLDVNHRLETELARLETGFSVTVPLRVVDQWG